LTVNAVGSIGPKLTVNAVGSIGPILTVSAVGSIGARWGRKTSNTERFPNAASCEFSREQTTPRGLLSKNVRSSEGKRSGVPR